MPLQKLEFRPGVNREGTTLANEGGWFESDKIRFRSGFPEKIGGWVKDTGTAATYVPTNTFYDDGTTLATPTPTYSVTAPNGYTWASSSYWGVCRSMWNWNSLAGNGYLSLGTNLKFYIQNGVNGLFYDVTPIRDENVIASNAFTTVNASTTVTVNDPGHGAQTGDFVCISGVVGAVNGIDPSYLNREFQITYLNGNQYNIVVGAPATSSGTTGAATFTYQITTGLDIYTVATGWGAGSWGGYAAGAPTTTLNGSINASATTITLTSNAAFAGSGTVVIDGESINYAGKGVNTLTGCTRGANGSTAASHTTGATVTQVTSSFSGWGAASATGGFGQQLRIWSQSNYGQDLIFNPRGGAMYYWAVNTDPNIFDRGQIIKANPVGTPTAYPVVTSTGTVYPDRTCPSVANLVVISDASRFVIAFGTNDPSATLFPELNGAQDPLLIRWSQQEEFYTWEPSVTNQAGDYRLSRGSQIVAAQQTRQEILVWTDAALYSMQYLGPPYVWGFQIMGDNISIAGPNVVSVANNVTYWMGTDKFYMYSGRVETLPCTLRQYVFDNINMQQSYQFFSSTNEGYNEIWWFYCSITGTNYDGTQGSGTPNNPNTLVDRYVVFNHLERTWYYGSMPRTAWLDSPLRTWPMSAGYGGMLLYQENGNDDGSLVSTETSSPYPITAYVQSSDFDIGDGHNFGIVWRIIPDVTFDGSDTAAPSVDFTVRPRQNPGTNYGSSDSPPVISGNNYSQQRYYNVQQFTEYAYVRIRGRQMAFKISSSDLGVAWQLGTPRLDVRPDGRR